MIEKPTLFILGAGASKPYGFPTARELRALIVKSFYDDYKKLYISMGKNDLSDVVFSDIRIFVESFERSSIYSVDKYLGLHPSEQESGKLAITFYIRQNEINMKFRENIGPDYYKEDWYSLLFNRMIEDIKESNGSDKFKENKIAFITFNYDNSLEYFLAQSFSNAFSENRYLNTDIPFPIVHVYGQLPRWGPTWGSSLNYRETPISVESNIRMSRGIHVIGERLGDELKEGIKKLIAWSKRIFFCGFGYAKDNLEAINFPINLDGSLSIYGSAKGKTDTEIQRARFSLIENPSSPYFLLNPRIEKMNTFDLLREFL